MTDSLPPRDEGAPPPRSPFPRPAAAPAPRRRGEGGRRPRRRGKPWVFLIANAIPAGAVIGWFALPEATRQRVRDAVPSGVAARATAAAICFGVLVVLARVVLPAARGAILALSGAMGWFRARRGAARVALYPAEAATGLAWFLAQCLFAVDAALVLASGLAFLGYVAKIVQPGLFPFLPG